MVRRGSKVNGKNILLQEVNFFLRASAFLFLTPKQLGDIRTDCKDATENIPEGLKFKCNTYTLQQSSLV